MNYRANETTIEPRLDGRRPGSTVQAMTTPRTPEVVYALPSANEANARRCLPKWLDMGYRVITLQDRFRFTIPGVEVVTRDHYDGYYRAANHLARAVVPAYVRWVVFGGDDMLPDPNKRASVIAAECEAKFKGTMGVMQPIGDDLNGTDRICGSPWIGREFIQRAYRGLGPFPGHYFHFYGDEELLNVTSNAGVLWQRPDLNQYHDHWTRHGDRPKFYDTIQDHWKLDQAIFNARKAAGFPGADLAGVSVLKAV